MLYQIESCHSNGALVTEYPSTMSKDDLRVALRSHATVILNRRHHSVRLRYHSWRDHTLGGLVVVSFA